MISGGGSSNFANTCSKMALWTLDQCTDYEHSKTIMVKHTYFEIRVEIKAN